MLRDNINFQGGLREDLVAERGYMGDQLGLRDGGLVLRNTETNVESVLVPPIIEVSKDDGQYVLDGAHRIWGDRARRWSEGARTLPFTRSGFNVDNHYMSDQFSKLDPESQWREFDHFERLRLVRPAARLICAIVVLDPAFPSYARPNSWKGVKVVEEVPTNLADKKDYRTDYPGGYKALYRDFSRLGSSGSRGA